MNRLGEAAESLARAHLEAAGLEHLASNVSYPVGELDLVMRDGDELVIVEVRHRADPEHGAALETLTPHKLRRVVAATERYLQDRGDPEAPLRFDVVALDGPLERARLTWLRAAFEAGC